MFVFFFFKQKTAYEMRISDWSSDVCSATICLVTHFKSSCRASPSLLVRLGVLMSTHRRYSTFVRSLSPSIRTLFARSMGRCGMAAAILVYVGDRKSTRLHPVTNAHIVCSLRSEKTKNTDHKLIS